MKLLNDNNNFGLKKRQISIVQQGDGVPALSDNDATIAMDSKDPCKIQAKPHGQGDIHALLHSNHVALKWLKKGLEWVIFFQDTNVLSNSVWDINLSRWDIDIVCFEQRQSLTLAEKLSGLPNISLSLVLSNNLRN